MVGLIEEKDKDVAKRGEMVEVVVLQGEKTEQHQAVKMMGDCQDAN